MSVEEKKKERVVLLIFAAGPDRFDALGGDCVLSNVVVVVVVCTPFFLSLSLVRKKSKEGEENKTRGLMHNVIHLSQSITRIALGTLNIFEKSFPFFFLVCCWGLSLVPVGGERERLVVSRGGVYWSLVE